MIPAYPYGRISISIGGGAGGNGAGGPPLSSSFARSPSAINNGMPFLARLRATRLSQYDNANPNLQNPGLLSNGCPPLLSSGRSNNNFLLTNDINDLEMLNGGIYAKKKTAKRATLAGQKKSRKRRSLHFALFKRQRK